MKRLPCKASPAPQGPPVAVGGRGKAGVQVWKPLAVHRPHQPLCPSRPRVLSCCHKSRTGGLKLQKRTLSLEARRPGSRRGQGWAPCEGPGQETSCLFRPQWRHHSGSACVSTSSGGLCVSFWVSWVSGPPSSWTTSSQSLPQPGQRPCFQIRPLSEVLSGCDLGVLGSL